LEKFLLKHTRKRRKTTMDLHLVGKRAFVTGSSSNIGERIAKTLAQEGAHVAIHGRNAERANRVVQAITRAGGQATAVIGDLTTDQGAQQAVEQVVSTLGAVDILINNAGGVEDGLKGWSESGLPDWKKSFEQNIFSAVRILHAVVPQMRVLGWGRIVQIATGWATQPGILGPYYGAAKAALVNVTVSLAKEMAGTGVTVNTVSPGYILTPRLEQLARDMAAAQGWGEEWADIEAHFVRTVAPNPTGHVGRIEDIATAVTFLSSPLAGFINGANLRVDGGSVASIN
jgi:NAD(P)-dependent dehydrogenase (short-subunit alcohol dehydrogenase family)